MSRHKVSVEVVARDRASGSEAVVARLHALQPSIPAHAYADLMHVASGSATHLGRLASFFARKDCVALVGKGSYGLGFRLCASSSCSKCLLLKVVDTSTEKGDPEDLFVESRIHAELTAELGGSAEVGGRSLQACPHFPRLLQHVEQRPYLYLFMDLVRDYQTMKVAVERMSAAQIKACMFQILYTLAVFQQAFPHFRHNDLHLENILVTRTPPPAAYVCQLQNELLCFRLQSSRQARLRGVQILDFGLASAAALPNHLADAMAYKGYGTQHCDLYDLHVLLEELRDYKDLPQLRECLRASERWIPARFFKNGPLFLGSRHRLSTQGQSELQRLHKRPLDLLMDSYFADLRADAARVKPAVGYDFS